MRLEITVSPTCALPAQPVPCQEEIVCHPLLGVAPPFVFLMLQRVRSGSRLGRGLDQGREHTLLEGVQREAEQRGGGAVNTLCS